MDKTSVCPICGSTNWEYMGEEYEPEMYHCHECDNWFGEEDEKREILRQKISAFCSSVIATEENPIRCDIEDEFHIEGVDEAAQGLSESEKPQVMSIFQDPEGIVWVQLDYGEPIELEEITVTDSLEEIVRWLEKNV